MVSVPFPSVSVWAPSAIELPATPASAPMVRSPLAALMSNCAPAPVRPNVAVLARLPAPSKASVPALTVALQAGFVQQTEAATA